MNKYIFVAGVLTFLLGLGHSIKGELQIFKKLRKKGSFLLDKESGILKKIDIRILWATWHIVSFFGWVFASILIKISFFNKETYTELTTLSYNGITYSIFASAILILLGTKAKHPAWVVLLIIGVLLVFGSF